MIKYKFEIVCAIAVLLLFALFKSCQKQDIAEVDKEETTKEVRYRYINKVDTIRTKPIMDIKYMMKDSIVYISNPTLVIKDFKPSDYQYEYHKSVYSEGNRVRVDVDGAGWGQIDRMDYVIHQHDTLADTITTIKVTKFKAANVLYLSGQYNMSLQDKTSLKGLNLDYTIRNKVIIGTQVMLDGNNQPYVGAKVGLKLN